jgi:hypothetical protein
MIVTARNLVLRNINQLIELVSNGKSYMGILDRVTINADQSLVTVRISGEAHTLHGDTLVNIMRSSELHEMYQTGLAIEDLRDAVSL